MKRIVVVSVMAVMMALGGTALAGGQTVKSKAPTARKRSGDCAEQKKRNPGTECVLDMEAEEVKGNKVGQDGENIVVRKPTKGGSLIRVRSTMVDKIIKSSNNQ